MTDSNWIFTTTGFTLAANEHYQAFVKGETPREALLNQDNRHTQAVSTHYERAGVQLSATANFLMESYTKAPTHTNLLLMVDFVCWVLGKESCVKTMMAQCKNPHLSATTLQLLRDVVTGNVEALGNGYHSVSGSSRFVLSPSLPPGKAQERAAFLFKDLETERLNWVSVLLPLVVDKKAFVTFYRHVFVDFY